MARRVRVYSTLLSMAIAQTQIEQTKRPIITAFTIQCACQNSVKSERSDEVSGSTDCATSVGFMGTSFPLSGSTWSNRGGAQCSIKENERAEGYRSRAQSKPNVSRKLG